MFPSRLFKEAIQTVLSVSAQNQAINKLLDNAADHAHFVDRQSSIYSSKDPLAWFVLLVLTDFEAPDENVKANLFEAIKNTPKTDCLKEGVTVQDSLLWYFLNQCDIPKQTKQKLLHNLAFFDFSEEEICQWPIEVLATLVTLSNTISDKSDLAFRATLFRSYMLQVPVVLSEEQNNEIENKGIRKGWDTEQTKNAKLTQLQGTYFVIIDKFLGVIATEGLFDAIENKQELSLKLNLILSLQITHQGETECNVQNRFLGKIFLILWGSSHPFKRSISDPSLLNLLSLDVFTRYFDFPLSQKLIGRVAENFLAILRAKDEFFIQRFFQSRGYFSGNKINWVSFQGHYFSAFVKAIVDFGDSASSHQYLVPNEVESVNVLAYIFDAKRTVEDLQDMSIAAPTNPGIFIRALTQYFAPALTQAIYQEDVAEKDVSYKRIRRTADLVKLLPPNLQSELYKDDQYVLFRVYNRVKKYERQLDKWEARGLGRDLKKETKMKVLNWLIYNFSMIKEKRFDSQYVPMQAVYDQYGPDLGWVTDMSRVDAWFRNVILQNSPRAQGLIHGLGLFGTVEGGVKGSKMAETLTLFSDEFMTNFISGTNITLLDIWNAAYPARKCFSEERRKSARLAVFTATMQQDIDDDNSDVSSVGENNRVRNPITAAVSVNSEINSEIISDNRGPNNSSYEDSLSSSEEDDDATPISEEQKRLSKRKTLDRTKPGTFPRIPTDNDSKTEEGDPSLSSRSLISDSPYSKLSLA